MTSKLTGLIGTFAGLDVVVIGEAMLDSYLEGSTGRLCREAPVPIVAVAERRDVPGGAANTAVNARSLGGRATFLSVVGDDAEGDLLRRALERGGVATDHVLVQPGRRTLAKHRVIAESQMLVRFDQGSTEAIGPEAEQALIGRLAELAPRCDAVIVSDYGYGILTPRVIGALEELQTRSPRILVVDSRSRLASYQRAHVTAVKPNYDEALQLLKNAEYRVLSAQSEPRPDSAAFTQHSALSTQQSSSRADAIRAHAGRILEITGARIAAVTLDTDGALVFERGRPPYRTYARPQRHCRAAGAGDTFVAALALSLAAGADAPTAAELASAAAAVVVGKEDTASCSAWELRAHLSAGERAVADGDGLVPRLELYRQQRRRIVFTNGCFDILHRGHVTYLNRAKALGDVLIVGVNSDDSIRRLKGPGRPINTLEDRVQVLAALSCIDQIVPFDEDTPHALIRIVRPDVFVKGGDYTRELLPEAPLVEELGGVVQILPLVEDRSTTGLIERIRAVGAPEVGGPATQPVSAPRPKVVATVGPPGGRARRRRGKLA